LKLHHKQAVNLKLSQGLVLPGFHTHTASAPLRVQGQPAYGIRPVLSKTLAPSPCWCPPKPLLTTLPSARKPAPSRPHSKMAPSSNVQALVGWPQQCL